MSTSNTDVLDADGSLFVHDVDTASCVFCPYGTGFKPGDQVVIRDERTAFAHMPRERVVEIKEIKIFRSTGRRVTLDLMMASNAEAGKIAEDSDVTVDVLLAHRAGTANFDPKHPPVVVYFTSAGAA